MWVPAEIMRRAKQILAGRLHTFPEQSPAQTLHKKESMFEHDGTQWERQKPSSELQLEKCSTKPLQSQTEVRSEAGKMINKNFEVKLK